MKIAFRLEARSDTGLKRSKNDDSGYGGRYLAVVADGMGATWVAMSPPRPRC